MENSEKKIYLKKSRKSAVLRFHPWVFSGAIYKIQGNPQDGDMVKVCDENDKVLATGHYHDGSIAVRIFNFGETEADAAFWLEKLRQAFITRQCLGLVDNASTNAYRLVHGEGDGFSGLIIDIYGDTAVFQAHSIGMHRAKGEIVKALRELYGERLTAVYDKSESTLPKEYAKTIKDGYLYGENSENISQVSEHNHQFLVNWATGQKTGFFLDQRDNRKLVGEYAAGKRVLNAFCYSGGFSIYALKAGAKQVDSVDASKKAIELVDQNVEVNGLGQAAHNSYTEDVMKFLKSQSEPYELMILDPPAYAKNLKKRHRAVQGYKRLNVEGLKRVKSGGLLFTFSCSQVVDRSLFYNTITAAAIEARRNVRVLRHLSQPADHPVNIFHPEGSYLKGLMLYVE